MGRVRRTGWTRRRVSRVCNDDPLPPPRPPMVAECSREPPRFFAGGNVILGFSPEARAEIPVASRRLRGGFGVPRERAAGALFVSSRGFFPPPAAHIGIFVFSHIVPPQ